MKERNYQTSRFFHLIISFLFFLFLFFYFHVTWPLKFTISIFGLILGYWMGHIEWKDIHSRIDKRNIVILYFTDSGFYSILIFLFLIQSAPTALLKESVHI